MLKKIFAFLLSTFVIFINVYSQSGQYKIVKTFHLASSGGWDYLAVNNNKLYVSHGTQVNILNKHSGDSVGIIENTTGVHGIAFVNGLNKGFTSNGRLNNVTVFDLTNDKPISHISTGQNPDAILYDSFSKKIYTCNGGSKDLSVIDPASEKVIATIALAGKPETAVSDEAGKLFVNIEDKNEIVAVNTQTYEIVNRWPLVSGEGPTGLAIDTKTNRLFSSCDNKLLIIMNAMNGNVVAKLPIGDGCDGDAFDPDTKNIYTSNGEGTMTVIHENSANDFKVTDNVKTKKGARTIAVDKETHSLFLPTAMFQPLGPNAVINERPKMVEGSFQILVLDKD